MGFKTSKYMTGMKKSANFKTLSVAALASIATVSTGVNAVQAADAPITPTLTDSSAYTLTNVSSQADNTITKYTYNESTGRLDKEYFRYDLSKTEYGTGTNSRYYKWVDDKMVRIEADASGNPTETPELTFKYNSTGVQWRPNNQYVYGDYVEQTGAVLDGWGSTSSPFDCKGVQANFVDNAATWGGGHGAALRAFSMAKYGDITGTFIGNHSVASGGAIYNYAQYTYDPTDAYAQIGDITGDFIGNYVNDVTGDFMNHGGGGAIFNSGIDNTNFNISIGNINGNFIRNYTTSESFDQYGGAIQNMAAEMGNITGDFVENYNSVSGSGKVAKGGAIYNGAINAAKGSTIGDIKGDFIGNYATSTNGSAYGGAIYNAFEGDANDSIIINSITGNFYNNSVTTNSTSTSSVAYGSAIYNNGKIGAITGNFYGNTIKMSATYSSAPITGAIHNEGTIDSLTGKFANNTMTYSVYSYGVQTYTRNNAIYNKGTINSANVELYGDKFVNDGVINDLTLDGYVGNYYSTDLVLENLENGIIKNANIKLYDKASATNNGDIEYLKGDFNTDLISDSAGFPFYNYGHVGTFELTTKNGIRNQGTIDDLIIVSADNSYSQYYGGVVSNSGTIGNITGDFSNNYAENGGALSNSGTLINSVTGDFIGNRAKYGGAIYNSATINSIVGNFVENSASIGWRGYAIGGAIHNTGTIGKLEDSIFEANSAIAGQDTFAMGGAIYNRGGTIDLHNVIFKNNYVESKHLETQSEDLLAQGGAIYNLDGTIELENVDFNGNYVDGIFIVHGGAIYNESANISTIKNSRFVNNYVKSEKSEVLGGAIYTSTDLNLVADNGIVEFTGNYVEQAGEKDDNAIYVNNVDATLNFELKNNGKVILNDNIDGLTSGFFSLRQTEENVVYDNYNVNITGDGTGTFHLFNDIRNADVSVSSVNLNTINNQVYINNFNSLTVTGDTNVLVDVDLANETMDRFTASEYGSHSGNLNVAGMNLLSDAPEGRDTTEIYFAEQGLKDNVTYGGGELPHGTYQTTLYTPIYKYNAMYDNRDDAGYFIFTRGDKEIIPTPEGGGSGDADKPIVTPPSGNPSGAFNPAVLGSSTAAQAGAIGTVHQAFNYAFQHSADFMNIPYLERVSMRDRNKYALSLTGDATDMGRYSPLFQPNDESSSVWVKPYATFENVPLKNGPKVSNITYGTLVGFDSEMQSLKRGWDRVWTGYIGYNGASQRYSGIDSTQNGGLIGGTMTLYKGNFFNATTVSVGANVANNQTMYGSEDFAMLLSGIGNKTGYNFEFKEGKLILQPSMLMSYTFVNTFDYTNAAGVKIDNKPLHALQLAPGVKVIGNLKGGWQPYASVSMVWNLMGESDATANGVKLPEMSIKPYVQYGVGLQKRIKDHFMAYGQAMVQNGGRNGVSLTAGFRWALGHDCKYKNQKVDAKKQDKISSSNEILRSAQNDRGKSIGHYEEQSDVVISSNNEIATPLARNDKHKKILKQMTPEQRAAYGGKYYNTSRTAKSGSLRQY